MHKIDGAGHVSGQFVSEDAAAGRAPTLVTPEWLNAVQGELVSLVQAAGIVLDKGNSAQVLAALKMIFGDGPGAVSFFARSTAPIGYMKANGAAVSRSAYAALFASVGTTFGAGDGSTTFNLPDLRGEFLRGFDDGRGIDIGRTIGSAQSATEIGGYVHAETGSLGATAAIAVPLAQTDGAGPTVTWVNANYYMIAASVVNGGSAYAGSHRVRSRNVALLACIKY